MEEKTFDLSNPFEKAVYERLMSYIDDGSDHDTSLKLLGRDFPYMDSDLIQMCVDTAYKTYFNSKGNGNNIASIKSVVVVHSNHLENPFYSHVCSKFHVPAEEDLFVGVLFENPFYLYDSANIHISLSINGIKVNEFKHRMDTKERRNVRYIPLNLSQIDELKTDGVHDISVEVVDENIPGHKSTMYCTVYRGSTSAAEAFEELGISICDDCGNDGDDMLEIERIDSIKIHATVNYNGGYGYIPNVDAVVKIKPSSSVDKREGLICPLRLNESPEGSGMLYGSKNLFNIPSVYKYNDEPIYKLQPGKYSIEFYIWDNLLWRDEVEFRASEPEAIESEMTF